MSEQSVHNWKRIFLESGKAGLAQGVHRRNTRELALEAETEELKAALGEAHVEPRVWKKGADYLPPFADLEITRIDVGMSILRFAALIAGATTSPT